MSENKHTSYDLAQMQSLPLEAKIIMTKQRIKDWYESWVRYEIVNTETGKTRYVTATEEPSLKENEYIESATDGQVYVSFSGGKDSTVLKHIVDSMYDDVPALFVNTGLEYPEIQKFAMSQKNVITIRPDMRFDEVIKEFGYPAISKEVAKIISEANRDVKHAILAFEGKCVDGTPSVYRQRFVKYGYLVKSPYPVSHKCCDVMKKKPAKMFEKETGRLPIIGTMASESLLRYKSWKANGCNAFNASRPSSQPLSFWTEQDVLDYLKRYNIPYCSVYGDIIDDNGKLKTTGCIFCMFGCHLEKSPNRFQLLKQTHPRQWEYCIGGGEMVDGKWQPNKNGLGLGKVLDYIGVKYE